MHSSKILIITYYWPPAGGPGVQRWLKFVKYLPEFGWEPTVFVPENPSYPITDESLLNDISPDLKIIKNKIWEPYGMAEFFGKSNKKYKAGQFDVGQNQSWKSKLSIWIRGNFFIPDARVFWVRPSAKKLKAYLKQNQFDAVVTTGPPHSVHLIGLALKNEFPELRWIADFRDPWTEISYYKHLKLTKTADAKHRKLEKQVFQNADITLATSFADAENFRRKGANAFCVTNGFDGKIGEDKVKDEVKDEVKGKDEVQRAKFTLSYIGVLEQLRNPNILWQVLNEILTEHNNFKNNFELKFVGRVDDRILSEINLLTLKETVNNLGYLSHGAANVEMQDSDLLLITNFPDERSKGIIPGKIFEYLATGNQILSFGPIESDVKKILDETNAGRHFGYEEKAGLKTFILQQYAGWKTGNRQAATKNIEQFSRKNLTQKLVAILETKPA